MRPVSAILTNMPLEGVLLVLISQNPRWLARALAGRKKKVACDAQRMTWAQRAFFGPEKAVSIVDISS